jgi:L-malate glycosyltransferase
VRLRSAPQFHATLAYGDAVGNDCFELQRLLWSCSVRSEVFAEEAKPEVTAFVRPWRDLAREPVDGAALFVHMSMGNDAIDGVTALPLRKVLVHHNITPARYFAGLNEHAERYAARGREQLAALAKASDLGIADSEFNRRELEELGMARSAVVPILVDWSAFDEVRPDAGVLARLRDERTAIVAIGQILPQKATHDVIAAFARYRERDRGARLYLVGSTAMSAGYLDRLQDDVRRLGVVDAVTFTGSVPMDQLVAYYRGATALVTLSDHEGFCVPLLEAMRSDLPIVAHAAGAIPWTLGDAGVLLHEKSPDAVADALDRAVHDEALRRDLVEKGRRRLAEFAPDRVESALRDALALVDWELPRPRRKQVAVLSSDQRCGIHHYSLAVAEGLRARGHDVTFVGVPHLDAKELARQTRLISRDTDAVLVEHEHGIFSDVPLVRTLLSLWRRRIPVVLSLHELEPEKFHHFRLLSNALHYRPRYAWPLELIRAPWVALRIANWFLRYRAVLALTGSVPRRLIVHSHRSNHWFDLLSNDERKKELFPLVLMPLENTTLPRDDAEKRALRERLGLPADRFIFVSPGFFFRRKRFIDVISAAPEDAVVVLSGTRHQNEPEYFDEVVRYARGRPNVVINTDYETMGQYVAAADAVVLYYEDVFQSAVAAQAIWAGLPCIFSDARGFAVYHGAGLVARDSRELGEAMREIPRSETYARLRARVRFLQRMLSPERNADRYLVGIE